MKKSLLYGFGGSSQVNQTARGSSMIVKAAVNDNVSTSEDNEEAPVPVPEKKAEFKPVYAYFVLFLVLICRIMVQWHRQSLSYAYGYTGLGLLANNPVYEISTAYPELASWFGLLTGLIYTAPYSLFGLAAGQISDNVNRKIALGIVIVLASLCMGMTGFSTSFGVLIGMRIIHGMLNAASNPLSFSLIADYFPKENRATANSLI
jgi:MFS family permease